MKRDTSISIAKGIAIILMVIAHAEAPGWLCCFIFEFHMPLFFITAGFFFSTKYLNDEATFVKKRIKGLYWPFVKWSVFFLLIHNLMFKVGVLNETYGNVSGGVTHPYTWHQMQQNFWNIITAMGGYDVFLAGAFWFFRGLFVASILFLILYKVYYVLYTKVCTCRCRSLKPKQDTAQERLLTIYLPLAICLTMLLLCGWKTWSGLKVINLVQGGYRDMMGCFFFSCGFLFRQAATRYRQFVNENTLATLLLTLFFCAVVFVFSKYYTANMNWRSTFWQFLWLPLPALLGFLMTYNISLWIDRWESTIKRFLIFAGDNSLYVFIFHIVAYKSVSLLKIWYYGLDPRQIGCHMVIHWHPTNDWFWVLYTIAGVGLPLLCIWGYRIVKGRCLNRDNLLKSESI